ncbi:protein phosphatase PPM5, putative [Plasmodium ovale curtisi]|uniref:Protein phosphatase PPM5, putative n=1 Tax=Plasmodium ovale curtisi TaxID=864141 RepID=A0A1A8WAV2_PLAOA|nr:protein phosphatase PPM5, putative [Plasmodium ovale curtisi]
MQNITRENVPIRDRKNTRRRLSISTKNELPNDTDEIKRSIQTLRKNEDRFKESSENDAGGKRNTVLKEQEEEEGGEKKIDVKNKKIKNRSSVAGVRASHFQEDFEKKCVKIKGSVDKLNENGIGYVCRKGLKPESPNQDDFIIITMENLALYAIFDGHGPYGHDVSNYVQKELPYMIIKNENFLKNPKEVFTNAFLNIHDNIERTTNAYLESFINKGTPNSRGSKGSGDSNIGGSNNNNKMNAFVSSRFDLNVQALGGENTDESDTESDDTVEHSDNYSDEDGENDNEEKEEEQDAYDDHLEVSKKNKSTKYSSEKENITYNKEGQMLNKKKKKKKAKAFFDSTMSGTTATIIVHLFKEKKLYVAYVGDSRAVLGKRKHGSPKQLEAVELTKDHKPNSAAEKKRIISSGGQVMKLEGDIPYRVFLKNKFYPGLAMAIGDTLGHQIGIISEPDFMEVNINEDEDILVLICSDGVWEFITSEEAINLVYQFGYDNVMNSVQDAVENLAKESWDRWLNEEENIVDDITIQAIYLSDKFKKEK